MVAPKVNSRLVRIPKEEISPNDVTRMMADAFNTPAMRKVLQGPLLSPEAQRALDNVRRPASLDEFTMESSLRVSMRTPRRAEGTIPSALPSITKTIQDNRIHREALAVRLHRSHVAHAPQMRRSEIHPVQGRPTATAGRHTHPEPRMTNVYVTQNGERTSVAVQRFRSSAELKMAINRGEVRVGQIVSLVNSRGRELPYLVYRSRTDHSIHWMIAR